MNTFGKIIPLPELSGPLVRYYTLQVQVGEHEPGLPELEDFFERHEQIERLEEPLGELLFWIRNMALNTGAKPNFFREENEASALPPGNAERKRFVGQREVEFQDSNNLRLYLLRLNPHVVILFNGGEKTMKTAQDCPNVAPYFKAAQKYARAIDLALKEGDIRYNHKQTDIEFDPELELPIL